MIREWLNDENTHFASYKRWQGPWQMVDAELSFFDGQDTFSVYLDTEDGLEDLNKMIDFLQRARDDFKQGLENAKEEESRISK